MRIEEFNGNRIEKQLGDWSEFLRYISSINIFEGLSQELVVEILETGNLIFLDNNERIINENEKKDDLYILLSGHLAITKWEDEQDIYITDISPIDIIGEMAFFTTNPRNASVSAMRDSILVSINKSQILNNPRFAPFISNIAKIVVQRLSGKQILRSIYKGKIKSISLIPICNFKNMDEFSNKFYKELQVYGSCVMINKDIIYTSDGNKEILPKRNFSDIIHELKRKYDYIIHVLDSGIDDQSVDSINQTDHIILVGNEETGTDLNVMEKYIFGNLKYIYRVELVLIRNSIVTYSKLMLDLLNIRKLHGYYNIMDQASDYQRLARCVIGKNTCLVLSGGGGRALSHIGTIKALLELKVPIDMIGGTSMGSLVAAAYATHLNYDDFYHAMRQFCFGYKFKRYTIPFVSIFTGKDFTNGFKDVCGESTLIENLHRRYLCVACNLSQVKLVTYDRGLLWQAVRASFSVPAILPPVIDEEGDILVDGCILNNLPVDRMHSASNGGKIIASQIVSSSTIHKFMPNDGIVSGASLMLRKLNPFQKKANLPNINFIFMKSMLISSQEHQAKMANESDALINHDIKQIGLFDFRSLDKIIDVAYQNTLVQFNKSKWDNL